MAQTPTGGSTAGLSGTFEPRAWPPEARQPIPVPALTLLFHPDFRRVGEWTTLSEIPLGKETHLSRTYPEFTSSDRIAGEPLADHYISRQPLRLQPAAERG